MGGNLTNGCTAHLREAPSQHGALSCLATDPSHYGVPQEQDSQRLFSIRRACVCGSSKGK